MSISSLVDFMGVPPRFWSHYQRYRTDASLTSTWGLSRSFSRFRWGLSLALYGDFYMALDTLFGYRQEDLPAPAGPDRPDQRRHRQDESRVAPTAGRGPDHPEHDRQPHRL